MYVVLIGCSLDSNYPLLESKEWPFEAWRVLAVRDDLVAISLSYCCWKKRRNEIYSVWAVQWNLFSSWVFGEPCFFYGRWSAVAHRSLPEKNAWVFEYKGWIATTFHRTVSGNNKDNKIICLLHYFDWEKGIKWSTALSYNWSILTILTSLFGIEGCSTHTWTRGKEMKLLLMRVCRSWRVLPQKVTTLRSLQSNLHNLPTIYKPISKIKLGFDLESYLIEITSSNRWNDSAFCSPPLISVKLMNVVVRNGEKDSWLIRESLCFKIRVIRLDRFRVVGCSTDMYYLWAQDSNVTCLWTTAKGSFSKSRERKQLKSYQMKETSEMEGVTLRKGADKEKTYLSDNCELGWQEIPSFLLVMNLNHVGITVDMSWAQRIWSYRVVVAPIKYCTQQGY